MASPCTFEEYSKIAEHSRARTITVVQAYIRPDGKLPIRFPQPARERLSGEKRWMELRSALASCAIVWVGSS